MTEQAILKALRNVEDPELKKDIVSLGFVAKIQIDGAAVTVELSVPPPARPSRVELKRDCEKRVREVPGVSAVRIELQTDVIGPRPVSPRLEILKGVRYTIAVASGKGGVGKSTVTANLSAALAKSGLRVGLLDCDVYGPSIPLMFGLTGRTPEVGEGETLCPIEAHGVRVMSIGFLSNDKSPVIWRGPMVHQMIQQFLTRVAWGELDFLMLDLPPGTGDTQLTLTQTARLSGAVIVTTPQEVSIVDARKGLKMFETVRVPVVGVIENMSSFSCPHCGEVSEIFSRGGAQKLCREAGVPLLGEIPIDPKLVETGDNGTPIVIAHPESETSKKYLKIAEALRTQMESQTVSSQDEPVHIQWRTKRK